MPFTPWPGRTLIVSHWHIRSESLLLVQEEMFRERLVLQGQKAGRHEPGDPLLDGRKVIGVADTA